VTDELHSLLEIEDKPRTSVPEWAKTSLIFLARFGDDKGFDILVNQLRAEGYGKCTVGEKQPLTVDEIAQRVRRVNPSTEQWDSPGLMD